MRKLSEQCSLILKDGHSIERDGDDCQHQGGRELGSDGKVNRCESLINVVTTNKPKVLMVRNRRLGPKGTGSGIAATESATADEAPPANRRDPRMENLYYQPYQYFTNFQITLSVRYATKFRLTLSGRYSTKFTFYSILAASGIRSKKLWPKTTKKCTLRRFEILVYVKINQFFEENIL